MPHTRGSLVHLRATAYHEAGHAVAALFQGRAVSGVQIDVDYPGNGRTRHARRRSRCPFDPCAGPLALRAAWNWTLTHYRAAARLSLAGPIAEAKALGQPLRAQGAYSDLGKCQALAEDLRFHWDKLHNIGDPPWVNPEALINAERAYVRRWVGRPRVWKLISRIAERLNREKVLYADEIAQEIGATESGQAQLDLDLHGKGDKPNKRARRRPAVSSATSSPPVSGLPRSPSGASPETPSHSLGPASSEPPVNRLLWGPTYSTRPRGKT